MTDSTTLEDHPFAGAMPSARPGASRRVPSLGEGPLANLEWRQVAGGIALAAGILAVLVAWFGISGTLDPGKQMPYLVSGGIGGAALIAVGMTLFLSLEHARDRAALGDVLERLDALEGRLAASAPPAGDRAAANGRRTSRAAASADR